MSRFSFVFTTPTPPPIHPCLYTPAHTPSTIHISLPTPKSLPFSPHHHPFLPTINHHGAVRGGPQAHGAVVRRGGEEVRVRGAEGDGGDDAAVAAVWGRGGWGIVRGRASDGTHRCRHVKRTATPSPAPPPAARATPAPSRPRSRSPPATVPLAPPPPLPRHATRQPRPGCSGAAAARGVGPRRAR